MAKEVLTAVRRTSPFRIDVGELLRRPGSSKRVSFSAPFEVAALPLARVDAGSEAGFDLSVESLVDGVHVRGTAEVTFELECRRCLRRLQQRAPVEIDEVFDVAADEDADTFPIEDDAIDLEPAVRDAVVLALPANPLCREDCKGLCPRCGADRNETDCGHVAEQMDVRWEALERLRESMEE